MANDPVTRHFFHGFIRLHILYHATKEPIYGAEITEELVRHGYRLSQGTLYPTLHMLEELGYLKSRHEVVAGKQRKYYQATSAGRQVLAGRAQASSWSSSRKLWRTRTNRFGPCGGNGIPHNPRGRERKDRAKKA